jgi:hypothetical protein
MHHQAHAIFLFLPVHLPLSIEHSRRRRPTHRCAMVQVAHWPSSPHADGEAATLTRICRFLTPTGRRCYHRSSLPSPCQHRGSHARRRRRPGDPHRWLSRAPLTACSYPCSWRTTPPHTMAAGSGWERPRQRGWKRKWPSSRPISMARK